ncbi:alpha/beta hydrolase [Streptomyces sp. NPDC059255]|uniref:alpha/beta hydrolase n=1 Tax=Streptomyces sp. NPDC059255 TaxID=3346793 RepID=UPI0036CC771D
MSQQMEDTLATLCEKAKAAAGLPVPPIDQSRADLLTFLAGFPEVPGVTINPADAGGVDGEWTVPDEGEAHGAILYFHGGGFIQGAPVGHRRIVSTLSLNAGTRALSIDYRLAPENPYPAALDDALTAYEWLIGDGGETPADVVLAGDSAGATLVAALLVRLRDENRPLPAGAFLISPATDIACTGESVTIRAHRDPLLSLEAMQMIAAAYVPQGADPLHPWISPHYADLAGLPPLLIHVGDNEVLLSDAERLTGHAQAAGVDTELKIWDGAFHVFHNYLGIIPEADQALAEAGAWIKTVITAP